MQASNSILLVEDDAELAELTAEYLSQHHFEVSIEEDGALAVQRITSEKPGLVILDLMLPGKDGISVCREARVSYKGPILMMTASNDSIDQILGLEIGADDYVKKPVEPRILLARIRALMRRSGTENGTASSADKTTGASAEFLEFDELVINKSARTVELERKELELTNPEFDVLLYLAENAGTIVSRDEMFGALRNLEYDGQNRLIDITLSRLRKKLGKYADLYLKTVRGKGYLFKLN